MKSIYRLTEEVNKVYLQRSSQILTMWSDLLDRSETTPISTVAANLTEADIMLKGYVYKSKVLLVRRAVLDSDYQEIQEALLCINFLGRLFSWVPLLYVRHRVRKLMKDFIEKWTKYEPGW